ncbi:terpene synthase family protein, partial [Streptomyces sp. NPDC001274]
AAASIRLPVRAEAARLRGHGHLPRQRVGPSLLPDFRLPFNTTLSPHLERARCRIVDWADRTGILSPQPGVPGSHIWDRQRLLAYDLPLCAAGIHPDATPEQLDLVSQWLTWGTYGDDWFPVVHGRTRDLHGARIANERLSLFMPLDGVGTLEPVNALERGLADLWARTSAPMDPEGRRTFRAAVEAMTASWIWELANQAQNRIPDPVDYIEMRRATFGSDLTMSLCRLGHGRKVPPEVYRSGPMRSLENAAADYACLLNDLFSYQKEIEYEGEIHNGVLVVQNFFGVDYPTGVAVVHDLMESRLRQFLHVAEHELPTLYDDFGLDAEAREVLAGYVRELRNWLAGILIWHRGCRRYREEDLRRGNAAPWHAGGPTGLGVSAARVTTLFAPFSAAGV